MSISRRHFLGLAAGLSVVGPRRLFAAGPDGAPRFAACARLPDGHFAAVLIDEGGRILGSRPLPDRGHEIAIDQASGRMVAFARRPGSFLAVFDPDFKQAPKIVAAAPGRTFYGHGAFSPDGKILYATENDYDGQRGVIGLYDVADDFRRIGEFSSGGVGPHELQLIDGGRTLAIANGGLDTSPEFGRMNLNTAEMKPSLALVSTDGGKVLANHELGPELSQLSIRHLATDRFGAIWFGCQHEGPRTELPPLAGRVSASGKVDLFALPEELRVRPRNYIGAVSASGDGETVAFSAPRGNVVFAFDAATARFAGMSDLADGCGIIRGLGEHDIVGAGGMGDFVSFEFGEEAVERREVRKDDLSFDNHLTML